MNNTTSSCTPSLPSQLMYKTDIQPPLFPNNQNIYLNVIGPMLQNDCPYNAYAPKVNESCRNKAGTATLGSANACGVSYVSSNPKLYDSVRAQALMIDRPPLTGELPVGDVKHDQIYTKRIQRYGGEYKEYSDIVGGNVLYYIPQESRDAYREPVFVTTATVAHVLVQDPMGVVRPEYRRTSQSQYDWDKCNQDQCDSFTHDSLEFRQELMEKQMRKRNEQEYKYYYI
jgi:hypothetical protein